MCNQWRTNTSVKTTDIYFPLFYCNYLHILYNPVYICNGCETASALNSVSIGTSPALSPWSSSSPCSGRAAVFVERWLTMLREWLLLMCAEGPWFAPGYGRGDGLKLYCYIYILSYSFGPFVRVMFTIHLLLFSTFVYLFHLLWQCKHMFSMPIKPVELIFWEQAHVSFLYT